MLENEYQMELKLAESELLGHFRSADNGADLNKKKNVGVVFLLSSYSCLWLVGSDIHGWRDE